MPLTVGLVLFLFPSALFATIEIGAIQCICSGGGTGQIEVIATGTAGPFTFQWFDPNGDPIPDAVDQNLTGITVPGIYEVTVTNAYSCGVSLSATVALCEGIDELQFQLTVSGGTEPF